MRNLIDIVPPGKHTASGRQHNGPCEICSGGEDRLVVWRDKGSFEFAGQTWEPIGVYYCRRCASKGDAIDYLRRARGLGFREALAELGITIADDRFQEAAEIRQTAERGQAQQEALALQRVRHAFLSATEEERAEMLHGDYARRLHDIETRHLAVNARHAFEALCDEMTDEQKARTGRARLVLGEAIDALEMRARLAHLDPVTAGGLV
jgi:hypothetical protein